MKTLTPYQNDPPTAAAEASEQVGGGADFVHGDDAFHPALDADANFESASWRTAEQGAQTGDMWVTARTTDPGTWITATSSIHVRQPSNAPTGGVIRTQRVHLQEITGYRATQYKDKQS